MSPRNQPPLLPSSAVPQLTQPSIFAPPAPQQLSEIAQIKRMLAGVRRYRWLVGGISILGLFAGFALSRIVRPSYYVESTIWISQETPQAQATGPTRTDALLAGSSWPELLKSFTILDEVVRVGKLYLSPHQVADSAMFVSFEVADRYRPGMYELVVDAAGKRVALHDSKGRTLESVAVGDSIGRSVGFRWQPPARELVAEREIGFSVLTLRDASVRLRNNLETSLPWETNLLKVGLRGTNAPRMATTLNTLTERFVNEAATLKKRNLVEFVRTLEAQLLYSENELREAESALENFRVSTITLPSEGGPVVGGLQETRDPVMESFFRERVEADQLKQDITALERAMAAVRSGDFEPDVFWAVNALQNPNQAPELRGALAELTTQEAALRAARVTYTDQHPLVLERLRAIRQLRTETIPRLTGTLLARWRQRAQDVDGRLTVASAQLRSIPSRTIEEMRLRRNVEVRQNLYRTLKNRFEEARLAEVSTVPDVSVLDRAVAPSQPNSSSAPKLMLMALLGSVGLACAIAVLLDRMDRRLNYPDQITRDMQLGIVGAVPRANKRQTKSVEEVAGFVEAFRSMRVNLQYALPRGAPLRLAISSPGQGDGKSFISANLALSFAEAGYRTLLLDGDTRRGELHDTFGTDRTPGLVDYLLGTATVEEILRPTTQELLTLIPCGKRVKRSPELLASQRLVELLGELQGRFDLIIIDTPPLGAGVDAFVMSIAAQNLLLVMRSGQTDRKLAESKLELLDRLPVSVLGAVLNDVPNDGQYRYYSYLPGYEASEEADPMLLRR